VAEQRLSPASLGGVEVAGGEAVVRDKTLPAFWSARERTGRAEPANPRTPSFSMVRRDKSDTVRSLLACDWAWSCESIGVPSLKEAV
jgi:hypothetical protein